MTRSSPARFRPLGPTHHNVGFTLLEVLATVVIIAIISAMALPVLSNGMKDRRTRQTAEEIARVYRDARLRAIGRGSAVLVHYDAAAHSFEVREAVVGPGPNQQGNCARLPTTSCTQAGWILDANSAFGSQSLETYRFNTTSDATGLKVVLGFPAAIDTPVDNFSICFTPLGRTFIDTNWPPNFSNSPAMTFAPRFRVYRTEPGETTRVGLERRVVLLPNGQARLHTAAGS